MTSLEFDMMPIGAKVVLRRQSYTTETEYDQELTYKGVKCEQSGAFYTFADTNNPPLGTLRIPAENRDELIKRLSILKK